MQLTGTFNHSTPDKKTQYDVKEGKTIPEQQHVHSPRTGKGVLDEELHFLYSVHLGLGDSLANMLKKGHCSSPKPHHPSLPMQHAPSVTLLQNEK